LFGFEGPALIRLSVIVELIHVATLVHDDVIDNAEIRRGKASVNAAWGNQVTVLMGDWLYMTSFYLALQLRDFRILDVLIDVTRTMVEGELIQLEQKNRTDISKEEYLDTCWRKTACLFSCCGRLGSILGGADGTQEEGLALYGRSIGMAFQLVDDLLDYTSNQDKLGKPVLKDLEEGKVTLPIISLLEKVEGDDKEFLQRLIRTGDLGAEDKVRVMEMVDLHGTLTELQDLADDYARQAQEHLKDLPASIYREALTNLAQYLVARDM